MIVEVAKMRDGAALKLIWQLANSYRDLVKAELSSLPEAAMAGYAKGSQRRCGDSSREQAASREPAARQSLVVAENFRVGRIHTG
jgi:hypothetical protein